MRKSEAKKLPRSEPETKKVPRSEPEAKKLPRSELETIAELDLTEARFLGRGRLRDARVSLSILREAVGKTQVEVAREAEMDQAEVSRVEHRNDVLLSTLRRFLRGLGADLEIIAVFPKTRHRVQIEL